MKRTAAILCFVACLASWTGPTAATELIAYFHGEWGNLNIFVIPSSGGLPTQLTASAGNNLDPEWSPDGTRLAFQSDRDGYAAIYVMNADGSEQIRVSPAGVDCRDPYWTPDGGGILCTSPRGVSILDVESAEIRDLVPTSLGGRNAKTSYAGGAIVFESDRDGDAEIYIMEWDSAEITRLTDNTISDQHPVFSPDGARIAFNSIAAGRRDFDLFVMRADGSDVRRITSGSDHDEYASWSPDGTKLVFAYGNASLYVINADGSGRHPLISPGFWTAGPSWQPADANE